METSDENYQLVEAIVGMHKDNTRQNQEDASHRANQRRALILALDSAEEYHLRTADDLDARYSDDHAWEEELPPTMRSFRQSLNRGYEIDNNTRCVQMPLEVFTLQYSFLNSPPALEAEHVRHVPTSA